MEAANDALSKALVSGDLPKIEQQYNNRNNEGHGRDRFPSGGGEAGRGIVQK